MLAARIIMDWGIDIEGIRFFAVFDIQGREHAIRQKILKKQRETMRMSSGAIRSQASPRPRRCLAPEISSPPCRNERVGQLGTFTCVWSEEYQTLNRVSGNPGYYQMLPTFRRLFSDRRVLFEQVQNRRAYKPKKLEAEETRS